MAAGRRRPIAVDVLADAPSASPVMGRVSRAAAVLAAVIGLVSLSGRIVGDASLEQVFPGAVGMRVNSAASIVLLALACFVPTVVRLVLATVAAAVGVLTLAEYAGRHSLGIDQLFAQDPAGAHPGRMSIITAVGLILLAVGHLLAARGRFRRAQNCALVVLLASCVVLLGYAYDVTELIKPHSLSRVALGTALGMLLLSVSALAAIPDGALTWAATSRDAGAQLVRRLLPLSILGLPVLGLLCVLGQRAGWFPDSATAALIVIGSAAAVGGLTWVAGRRLARVDLRRAQAIAELTALRIDLERQVEERAGQLQRRHNEIAVLEDRQRIAADLHDIVIQRLFAAGMYLQSGAEGLVGETRRRLDNAVETMDVAIKDLRASIFELGGRVHHRIDMTTAISDVCTESARVLGFEPDILIDDPEDDAEQYREDMLAVLREALANVARHAEATAADVVLRVGDGHVWLSITDNGKGMSEGSRRSGTRNMAQRAREHGGDCIWTSMEPSGTRVLWRVPTREGVGREAVR